MNAGMDANGADNQGRDLGRGAAVDGDVNVVVNGGVDTAVDTAVDAGVSGAGGALEKGKPRGERGGVKHRPEQGG